MFTEDSSKYHILMFSPYTAIPANVALGIPHQVAGRRVQSRLHSQILIASVVFDLIIIETHRMTLFFLLGTWTAGLRNFEMTKRLT